MSTQSEVLMKMLKEGTKKYYIQSTHDVHIDDFMDGEGEHVNTYELNGIINANTVEESVEKYVDTVLGFEVNFDENIERTENGYEMNPLVDKDNCEVNELLDNTSFNQWKEGRIVLYVCRTIITVYEMVKVS